jgi:hypothetical protein
MLDVMCGGVGDEGGDSSGIVVVNVFWHFGRGWLASSGSDGRCQTIDSMEEGTSSSNPCIPRYRIPKARDYPRFTCTSHAR